MTFQKGWALVAVPLFLCSVAIYWIFSYGQEAKLAEILESETVMITGGSIPVLTEMAVTHETRKKGLSGRLELPLGSGMLFVFDVPGNYPFWMPDMHFSIDILWLDEQMRVVTIASGVSPLSYPRTFASTAPAQYVLELPEGGAVHHGIATGTRLRIENSFVPIGKS